MKKLVVVLSMLLLTVGCFQVDQTIELKKDMSGTAEFHLGVDLEPMVMVMAQFGREMEGKKGPMTKAELDKAKAEFKKKQSTEKKSEMPTRAEIEKDMPKGIKLLDFSATEKDFGVDTRFKVSFDKLSTLVGIKMPGKKSDDPTQKSVIDSPFEGLQVTDQGKTFTLQTKPQNPAETVNKEAENAGGPKMDKDTEKMIKDALSKMRVSYRITSPFEVVSHNAMRVEGKTLVWEYTAETFEKMSKKKNLDDSQVRVTFKK
jgi:hypothetical protein